MGCTMSVEEKAALAISREIDRQIATESTLRDVKLLLLGKCVCEEGEKPPLTLSEVTPFTGRTELTLCSDYTWSRCTRHTAASPRSPRRLRLIHGAYKILSSTYNYIPLPSLFDTNKHQNITKPHPNTTHGRRLAASPRVTPLITLLPATLTPNRVIEPDSFPVQHARSSY
ncbi:hypothetical protein E2C01_068563 [Portunus trituberculatus]|uniref:Guanine nucleotide-binding protein G(O) subunit alpha n=1 Tax=Portunus trituberculatus TaxID=210409 RepID=A0A5B7HMR3_PORTR|nr:hypothetical protein [Portunus trituberculatus]